MMSVEFEPSRFDAVVAFYSIFHIPRDEHPTLFSRIHKWLKPDGYLLCTLSHTSEEGYTENDFFGVTMYWSNYGIREYLVMLADAGFRVVDVSSTSSGYEDSFEGVIGGSSFGFGTETVMAVWGAPPLCPPRFPSP